MNVDAVAAPSVAGPLGRRIGSGLLWSFLNNGVSRLGSFLVGIAMARLLVPEDFGVFAVGFVALSVMLSMNELGVSLALVRRPGPVDGIAPTVATLAIVWSAGLFAAMWLLAPLIAAGAGSPGATGVLRLLAVGVLVDAVVAVPAALLTRAFLQRRKLAIDLAAFCVSTPLSVGLALGGAGAWSLAWGVLAGSLVGGALTVLTAPGRCWPGWNLAAARELLLFGLPLAGTSLLLVVMLNIDYVVVSATLGPAALGLYVLAFNLCSWPVVLVSTAVRRVSLAGFSRMEEQVDGAAAGFRRSWRLVLALTLPLSVLLASYAGDLIDVLYGNRWAGAAAVVPALALFGVARVLTELSYDFLVARGQTRVNLWLHAVWAVTLVPVLLVAAERGGLRGVAIGHGVVVLLLVLPMLARVLHAAGVDVRGLFRDAAAPVAAAALVVCSAVLAHAVLDAGPLRILLGGGVGAALYVAVVGPTVLGTWRALINPRVAVDVDGTQV